MKIKSIITIILALGSIFQLAAEYRYVGGDISLLPEYESAGAKYRDYTGKIIPDLIPWLKEQGMNAMRVRLFNDPDAYKGSDKDPNACQDLEYIIPLCKRIKDAGLALVLDFHYSDTWADPAKQWTPEAWKDFSDEQLYDAIYEYTGSTLRTLNDNGIIPDFIQPGNEISYGMLWGPVGTPASQLKKTYSGNSANWGRLCTLLKRAIQACREECPDAGIILHTERVGNIKVQDNFYNQMKAGGVDYDIIGLSYYPYFHGKLSQLETAINSLEKNFQDKQIMIVETGYSYKWEVPGTSQTVDYDYSEAGQNLFASELVEMLLRHKNVDGLFWWWMEYNPYGTNLSNWYNAPLFNATNGKACPALKTICSFAADNSGVSFINGDEESADLLNHRWYHLDGTQVNLSEGSTLPSAPGIYLSPKGKIIIP